MAKVIKGRMTADIDGDFVVFLIGMRVNKPWKLHKWLWMSAAMPRMLKVLYERPELGFLGHVMLFSAGGPVVLQYWRSVEQLEAFAKEAALPHHPAWKTFNRLVGTNGDVGIWHETYQVGAGRYESIYGNMPRFGLAKAADHVPVARKGESAAQRRGAGATN